MSKIERAKHDLNYFIKETLGVESHEGFSMTDRKTWLEQFAKSIMRLTQKGGIKMKTPKERIQSLLTKMADQKSKCIAALSQTTELSLEIHKALKDVDGTTAFTCAHSAVDNVWHVKQGQVESVKYQCRTCKEILEMNVYTPKIKPCDHENIKRYFDTEKGFRKHYWRCTGCNQTVKVSVDRALKW